MFRRYASRRRSLLQRDDDTDAGTDKAEDLAAMFLQQRQRPFRMRQHVRHDQMQVMTIGDRRSLHQIVVDGKHPLEVGKRCFCFPLLPLGKPSIGSTVDKDFAPA